jgi:peptide-methionine (S)-S-oxide reductase
MGCFWCSEGHFAGLAKSPGNGIFTTLVGFAQGSTKDPTYEDVCSGKTNHVEVVQIVYDPRVRSFTSLLKDFWELHDPTTLNRQGNDVGTQYRSGIYFTTNAQKEAALLTKQSYQEALNERGIASQIVTEIEPLRNFSPAEEYHQQYDFKPGSRQYCGLRPTGVSLP